MYSSGKLILFILLLALALLWGKQNLMGLNEWVYSLVYQGGEPNLPLRLGHDQDAPRMLSSKREVHHDIYPEVRALRLDPAALSRTVMSEGDYTPQDIAVYVNRLHALKLKAVALSSPLHWELPADDMGLQSLAWSFNKHEHYALGLRAQTAALAEFTPEVLAESVIPLDQVEGDITALPSANKCMPNALEHAQGLSWGIDLIVGERQMENPTVGSKKCYPLLVRWNGEIYPTLPLKLAMDVLGLQTKDIRVRLGHEIVLGARSLPLDDSGRSPLEGARACDLSLESFVDGHQDESLTGQILVMEHQPEGWQSYQGRLNNLAQTLSLLLATQELEYVEELQQEEAQVLRSMSWRSHTGVYLMLFSLLGLWLFMMPLFPRAALYWIYLIFIPLSSIMLFFWTYSQGVWVNWSCVICLTVILLLFSPLRWKKVRRN